MLLEVSALCICARVLINLYSIKREYNREKYDAPSKPDKPKSVTLHSGRGFCVFCGDDGSQSGCSVCNLRMGFQKRCLIFGGKGFQLLKNGLYGFVRLWMFRIHGNLTKKAEPPPTRDVNRDSGTDSANGGWLRRLVRPLVV